MLQGLFRLIHVVSIIGLEAFLALNFSRFESFRALKRYGLIRSFNGPRYVSWRVLGQKNLQIGEFLTLKANGQIGVFLEPSILPVGEF